MAPSSARAAKEALQRIAAHIAARGFSEDHLVSFTYVEYQLINHNAGSPDGFAAAQTVAETLSVRSDSSATLLEKVLSAPHLVSRIDERRWRAAGQPSLASTTDRAGSSYSQRLPAGAWSFTPQGRTRLTFAGVRSLPSNERSLARTLARVLEGSSETTPPATQSLVEYGFLLATAPLKPGTRQALIEAMRSLPGIHLCASQLLGRGRRGDAFCVNGDPTDIGVLLDPRTGIVRVLGERLSRRTPFYPDRAVGELVGSYAFTLQASS